MRFSRVLLYVTLVGMSWTVASVQPALAYQTDDPPQGQKKADESDLKSQISDLKSAPSPEATVALALLGGLTPEHMKQLGQMLEQDWKGRPEWGDMAVAILKGDRMRMGMGWWRAGVKRYDWSWLKGHFDTNSDGVVDRDELPENAPLADKLFARLDRDLDGKITAADFESSEAGGPMSPTAMLNMMAGTVFSRLDTDSNGRVSLEELAAFFAKADSENLGFLTPDDLRAALDDPEMRKPPSREQGGEPPPAEMLRMFLTGQLGWLEAGPEYGDVAPDFTLATQDGSRTVTLSDSRGKKPVVLIFGSFT